MNFRNKLVILFICFIPFIGISQEVLTGVAQNAAIVKAAKKGIPVRAVSAVKLPFLEDFSNYTGYPGSDKWLDRQGYVNRGFAIYPPSIGVVTLDALDEYGQIYAHATRNPFPADTLTSNLIRLDSNFNQHRPMQVGDSLYLSFYYQPAGSSQNPSAGGWEIVGDNPEHSDKLVLEFGYSTGNIVFAGFLYGEYIIEEGQYYSAGDSVENPFLPGTYYVFESDAYSGQTIMMPSDSLFEEEFIWNEVWSSNGCKVSDWLAENPLQYFKQVMIPITDAQYFRDNFQFRFRNYASLDQDTWTGGNIVGWSSNCDQWNIDYIRLDLNRTINDVYPNDVAFVSPSISTLKDYQSMPWNQFRASDMITQFHNDLSNLSNSVKNTYYTFDIVKNHQQTIYVSPLNNENANPYYPNGLHTYENHATPALQMEYEYDGADSAVFTITHVFSMVGGNDICKSNDTSVFEQKFYNYYAYDDGTAEAGYCLLSTMVNPQASLAVKFTLAEPDTLQAVRFWFNHTLNDENVAPFTLMVWDDNNGFPGNVLYELPSQLPDHEDDYLDFVAYYLEEPLAVSGTFYVGFFQNHDIQLNLGFDQNNDARGKFFYRTAADWYESFYKGAPMIRPVLGKSFDHSSVHPYNLTDIKIYPNPTHDKLYVQYDAEVENLSYQILNIYGQCLETEQLQSGAISLADYAEGIYFIRLFSNNQPVKTEKIIKH
ncbi:MAG: T9SS type A sorting domain-containing protein [Bacteroidales bacterium]|nr:T9SS type A sorting domain-containing protein [Bacteroidales bacterium]